MTRAVLSAGRCFALAACATLAAFFADPSGRIPTAKAADDQPVLVFAAASLKDALDDAGAVYAEQKGVKVTASYAASPALAKQIESGAPADLFISADV